MCAFVRVCVCVSVATSRVFRTSYSQHIHTNTRMHTQVWNHNKHTHACTHTGAWGASPPSLVPGEEGGGGSGARKPAGYSLSGKEVWLSPSPSMEKNPQPARMTPEMRTSSLKPKEPEVSDVQEFL